jgi:hypothetical protein
MIVLLRAGDIVPLLAAGAAYNGIFTFCCCIGCDGHHSGKRACVHYRSDDSTYLPSAG